MNPTLSVLLPVYNGSEFLEETLNSILQQSFTNYELIIIDDGSQDNSRKIIEDYRLQDKRITPIYKSHSGLADCLNIGASIVKGDWIARADADDLCKSDRFMKQLDYVARNPDIVILGSGFDLIDKNGNIIFKRSFNKSTNITKSMLVKSQCFPHSSIIIKTEIFRKVNGYNKNYVKAQDWDLWLRCEKFGKIAVLPERLIQLREHDNRISYDKTAPSQLVYSHCATCAYYLSDKNKQALVDPEKFLSYRKFVQQQISRSKVEYVREIRTQLIRNIIDHGMWGSIRLQNLILFVKYKIYKIQSRRKLDLAIANKWNDKQ